MPFTGSQRFQLERKLGEGGMGIVYEAHDRERDMRVALKTLRHLDAASLYRFKREFRALSGLSHPNIVALYELVSEGDDWFLTMELVEGCDFVDWVRPGEPRSDDERRPLADADAIDDFDDYEHTLDTLLVPGMPRAGGAEKAAIEDMVDLDKLRAAAAQLARALQALHASGMVHRDLKPSNVRVTEGGRVVLMDFGIVARAHDAEDTPPDDAAVGTPAYMAPEQAAGDPPTAAADWYGFGVILYLALTGRLPFAGPRDEILMDKQTRDPTPPSHFTDGVPEDLEALCMDLLARRPKRRPTGLQVLHRLGVTGDEATDVTMTGGHLFVGREDELDVLRDAYRAAHAAATPAVLVGGASGMGKSTLVKRFLHEVEVVGALGEGDGHGEPLVLTARCHERESLSYKGFDGIVDDLSRALLELPAAHVAAVLPDDVDLLTRLFPVLRRVPGIQVARAIGTLHPHELRDRAVGVLRELLRALAAERPIVVAIDDLQWADTDSLDLLVDLVRAPAPERLLLVLSMRPLDTDAATARVMGRAIEQLEARVDVRRLEVGPLSAEDQRLMATQLLGGQRLARKLGDAFWAESGGSPLLLAELIRFALEAPDEIVPGEPIHIEAVLWRRAAQLPAPARALLEVICLAGEPMPLFVLATATDLSADERERASAVLRVAGMARIARPGHEPHLAAFHDKVRETVTAHISAERGRELHMRLAQALERWDKATVDALARHWLAAGDIEQALTYLDSAARAATDKLAFERAAELYAAAIAVAPENDPRRCDLLRNHADALVLAGNAFGAAESYGGAAALADEDDAIELRRLAADNLLRSGHIDDGLARLGDVMRELDVRMPRTRRGAIVSLLWRRLRLALRGRRYTQRKESEVPARDLGRLDTLYAAATSLGMIDHVRGAAVQNRHLLDALRFGEEKRVCRALAIEIPYLAAQGGRALKRAEELATGVLMQARRTDDPYVVGVALLAKGAVAFFSGKDRASTEAFRECETMLRTEVVAGAEWERVTARYFVVRGYTNMGRFDLLDEPVERTLEEAERRDDFYASVMFASQPATWYHLVRDDPDAALAALDEVAEKWPDDTYYMGHYLMAVARAVCHLYRGEAEEARAILEALGPRLRPLMVDRMPLLMAEIHMYEARAALVLGDHATARRMVRRLARTDYPIARAVVSSLRAPLALAAGDRELAQNLLGEALDCAREEGAEHFEAAYRYRLGALLGGNTGSGLCERAVIALERRGVRAPERMAAFLAPGFD